MSIALSDESWKGEKRTQCFRGNVTPGIVDHNNASCIIQTQTRYQERGLMIAG